jgi:hypothetical protein
MESFTGDVPAAWSTTTQLAVSQTTAQGTVHSGDSAVLLQNGAVLTQAIVKPINPGCYYSFSFFAQGESSQVSFAAGVTFITSHGNVDGAVITVRAQDLINSNRNFAYFRVITSEAPADVTGAYVQFTVLAVSDQQSMSLDDVSLTVA